VTLFIQRTSLRSSFFDFAVLAEACPRLEQLRVSNAQLKMDIDLEAALSRFAELSFCSLEANDLCNHGAGIDFKKLPAKLTLHVGSNPRLSGAVRGLPPGADFDAQRTQLTFA
jgi:hypothetical protein